MSKFVWEKGDIEIRSPLCTYCKKLTGKYCEFVKGVPPKKVQFEFGQCEGFKEKEPK